MEAHKHTRKTIVRLLSSMGSAKEISAIPQALFAARRQTLRRGESRRRRVARRLDALTSSLAFLQQVGLDADRVHGAGPQLDEELSAAGIEKQTVDGLRVTTPQALAIVRRVFQAQNLQLVAALRDADTRATSVVFRRLQIAISRSRKIRPGRQGRAVSIWRRSRRACVRARSR